MISRHKEKEVYVIDEHYYCGRVSIWTEMETERYLRGISRLSRANPDTERPGNKTDGGGEH